MPVNNEHLVAQMQASLHEAPDRGGLILGRDTNRDALAVDWHRVSSRTLKLGAQAEGNYKNLSGPTGMALYDIMRGHPTGRWLTGTSAYDS